MKRLVFLTCIGSLALALTALGAPKSGPRSGGGRGAPSAHAAPMRGGGGHLRALAVFAAATLRRQGCGARRRCIELHRQEHSPAAERRLVARELLLARTLREATGWKPQGRAIRATWLAQTLCKGTAPKQRESAMVEFRKRPELLPAGI